MMSVMRIWLMGIGLLWSFVGLAAPAETPEQFIERFTHNTWQDLEASRKVLSKDPKALKAFAEEKVLPYVAVEKMARYAMGKFWRQASGEQKRRFVEAFKDMLLRSYAKTVLNLEIVSMKVDKVVPGKRERYQVEQVVQRKGAPETKVIYRVYWDKKQQRWKIYDVVVENVSLLLNYRKVFTQQLQQKGIDAVIQALEEKNRAFLEKGQVAEDSEAKKAEQAP